jgi:hypothetical protein
MRNDKRYRSAVLITSTWRGWHLRRRWPALRRTLELQLVRPANNASKNANNGRADFFFFLFGQKIMYLIIFSWNWYQYET